MRTPGLQETEDLALVPDVVHAGVARVLSDPAKGAYFVLQVEPGSLSILDLVHVSNYAPHN